MTKITEESVFLALNGAHLKKMANATEIAEAVDVDAEMAISVLAAAVDKGWAMEMEMEGRFLLLPEGTAAVHEYYHETYRALRIDESLLDWYGRFETINEQFIKLVSDWQTTDGDDRVQSKLMKTVERLMKLLEEIKPRLPRYATYISRFGRSMSLVDRGDKGYVCKPTIDSIHNVWFEFHEDILSVLGRPRDA